MDPRFRTNEHIAIQEAALAGLKSMEHLIQVLSSQTPSSLTHINNNNNNLDSNHLDFSEIIDFIISKFKEIINLCNRSGHARFRRAPLQPQPQIHHQLSLDLPIPNIFNSNPNNNNKDDTLSLTISNTTNSSFLIPTTADGSVSNDKIGPFLTPISTEPPLSSSPQKICHNVATSSSNHCHCSKKMKLQEKQWIHVPAISSNNTEIPSDKYSWRKYGQKLIKGSLYPRGYYRCSTVKGCPARKQVERDQDDPTMLMVLYENEHCHTLPLPAAAPVEHCHTLPLPAAAPVELDYAMMLFGRF